MPEKPGIDVALCAARAAGPTAASIGPQAVIAAAAATVISKRKFRRRTCMLPSHHYANHSNATPFARALEGARRVYIWRNLAGFRAGANERFPSDSSEQHAPFE